LAGGDEKVSGNGRAGGNGVNGVIPIYVFVSGNFTIDGEIKAYGANGGSGVLVAIIMALMVMLVTEAMAAMDQMELMFLFL
jgi:hypothetical protein